MINTSPKIIFIGTPDFAVPILERLINSDYKPIAVFCALDKPVGRQQLLTPPPVKVIAKKYGIPIYQPANKNELIYQLKAISYKLIITAAYGLILPKEILDAPQYGCLNIHPSLLPKYRGPSPIQAAILNGDTATGVTIYKMDKKIDAGTIIVQEKIVVASAKPLERLGAKQSRDIIAVHKITTPELSAKLSLLGADLLLKTLPDWLSGKIEPTPQDETQTSYTKIIKKEDGKIDWQKSAAAIERQIRAFTPWPGSYGKWLMANGLWQNVKILEAKTSAAIADKQIGEIFLTDDKNLAIQTGDGILLIKKLQLEGGKSLGASDFLCGHIEIIGQILK